MNGPKDIDSNASFVRTIVVSILPFKVGMQVASRKSSVSSF